MTPCHFITAILSVLAEIVLLEAALLVFPTEVWMAEVHAGRDGPAMQGRPFNEGNRKLETIKSRNSRRVSEDQTSSTRR